MRDPHVLVIVHNLPVPLDRRTWLECRALVDAGYRVSVICPRGPGDPAYHEVEGVRIHKYKPPPPARGAAGYLWEFGYSWACTARLARRIWRRDPFVVVQACNPPDTYWAVARMFARRGVRFVYDQHDLNPELFRSRFGEPNSAAARVQHRALLWLERRSYRGAHHVISTNESYRQVALTRGRCAPGDVTVVRSGPDTTRMRPVDGVPELRRGRRHLAVYLGVMGPQDGVDVVLRALDVLVHGMGRDDLHVALLGFGDCLDELRALARTLRLDDYVTFTGRADARVIAEYLSTAHVGLSPDPKNPLNDVSTMNKTMEYMAYALPVVTFDLTETRVSAGDCAVYVEPAAPPDDADRFAKAVAELLDDPARRADMGVRARERAERVLDWQPQRRQYVRAYERLVGARPRQPERSELPERSEPPELPELPGPAGRPGTGEPGEPGGAELSGGGEQVAGRPLVDLRDPEALRHFAATRRVPGHGRDDG